MKFPINIKLESNRAEYELSNLYHNISYLIGESSTGKSSLYNLVQDALVRDSSNSKITCKEKVLTLSDEIWLATDWRNLESCVYIVDEEFSFLNSKDFREFLYYSGSATLIISRDIKLIEELIDTYAVYEIFPSSSSGRFINKFSTYFSKYIAKGHPEGPLFTEDKRSGKELCERCGYKVENGLGGANNVKKLLRKSNENKITLFVDLVAFAPFFYYIRKYRNYKDILICDCKSAEHILLQHEKFKEKDLLDYKNGLCDFSRYKSLERFYTEKYKEFCKNILGIEYDKSKLLDEMIDAEVVEYMRKILPIEQKDNKGRSLLENLK